MKRIRKGDLRDKVAALDPAAASELSDAEAGGIGLRGAARGADRHQARAAPTSRAVSARADPAKRGEGTIGRLAAAGVLVVALVGVALWLTLPVR